MFILRPSSPLRTARVEEPVEAAAAEDQGPYIDAGLPIPESYDIDILRALLQDPFHIFIYWEVREMSLLALTRYFSAEEARTFHIALKLTDMAGRHEAYFEVARLGRYWMTVFPDREYEFEIGVRSPLHGFISLLRSNRVRTPRGTVSPAVAEEPGYRLEPPQLVRMLEASGFSAEKMMNITVAGTGAAGPQQQEALIAALMRLPESLRAAILVAATGNPLTLEMIERLPEPIRTQLLELIESSGGQVASIGLLHYLPEILHEVLQDDRELIGDRAHPLHIAPRFFIGASESGWPGGDIGLPGLPQGPSSDARYRKPELASGIGRGYIVSEI